MRGQKLVAAINMWARDNNLPVHPVKEQGIRLSAGRAPREMGNEIVEISDRLSKGHVDTLGAAVIVERIARRAGTNVKLIPCSSSVIRGGWAHRYFRVVEA